jgi:hypothetical protein
LPKNFRNGGRFWAVEAVRRIGWLDSASGKD